MIRCQAEPGPQVIQNPGRIAVTISQQVHVHFTAMVVKACCGVHGHVPERSKPASAKSLPRAVSHADHLNEDSAGKWRAIVMMVDRVDIALTRSTVPEPEAITKFIFKIEGGTGRHVQLGSRSLHGVCAN